MSRADKNSKADQGIFSFNQVMGGYGHVTNNMANMNFFFVKNSWYFIVAEWPTGGEDKIKHNGVTDI